MIRIEAVGLRATVQDRGRFGHLRDGVPPAGPADPLAFAAAQALVGNDRAAAAVEIIGGPFTFTCDDRRLVVVTAHRRESFGAPLAEICRALRDIARAFAAEGLHVVYPVHLNPNVREPVMATLGGMDNVSLIEPLDYVSMVHLMKRATLILTDSGGIQEEAPSLRVPVLVLREVTERPEAAAVGAIRVVGTAYARIMAEVRSVLENPGAWTVTGPNPYGDGHAAERVVAALLSDAAR